MILKINNYEDRKNIVIGLINAGYKVWTEEKQGISLLSKDYIVHIEEIIKPSMVDNHCRPRPLCKEDE